MIECEEAGKKCLKYRVSQPGPYPLFCSKPLLRRQQRRREGSTPKHRGAVDCKNKVNCYANVAPALIPGRVRSSDSEGKARERFLDSCQQSRLTLMTVPHTAHVLGFN